MYSSYGVSVDILKKLRGSVLLDIYFAQGVKYGKLFDGVERFLVIKAL